MTKETSLVAWSLNFAHVAPKSKNVQYCDPSHVFFYEYSPIAHSKVLKHLP